MKMTSLTKIFMFCVYISICFNQVQSGHYYFSTEREVAVLPGEVYEWPVVPGAVTTQTGCFRFEVTSNEPVFAMLMKENDFNEFKSSGYTSYVRKCRNNGNKHDCWDECTRLSCDTSAFYSSFQENYVLVIFNRETDRLVSARPTPPGVETARVSIKTEDSKYSDIDGRRATNCENVSHPSSGGGGGTPKAALIGGIVGGVVFLIVLIVIGLGTYFYFKKKRSANTPSTVPASSLDMVKKEDVEKGPGIQAAQQMANLQTMKMDDDLTEVNTGMISLVDDTPPPAPNNSFEVMVPAGTAPGTLLQVTVPDGRIPQGWAAHAIPGSVWPAS